MRVWSRLSPAPVREKLRFSHPHYSDMLTKSNKAKKQEGDSKVKVCPEVHRKLPDTGKREQGCI